MKKTYKISEEKKTEALNQIKNNGGIVYQDNSFEISGVRGFYEENGNSVTITITDKPWLAGWGMIENKLDEFFNN